MGGDLSSLIRTKPVTSGPRRVRNRGPGFHASDTLKAADTLDKMAGNFSALGKEEPGELPGGFGSAEKEERRGFFDTKSEKQIGAAFLGLTALEQRDVERGRKHAESDALQDLRKKYGDAAFVHRHAALESQMNNTRSLAASITSLRKQMEGLATGDQRQTFATDPISGRRLNG